jgi:multidrug transporter EmrE-like cation transporter
MNVIVQLIMLAIVMGLIESYSMYSAKQFGSCGNILWYIKALIGYALIVFIFSHLCKHSKVGVVNTVWNAITMCTMLIIGRVAFDEKMSTLELSGVVLAITGVIMTQC